MAGTLTAFTGATSLRFLTNNHHFSPPISTKTTIKKPQISPKCSLHTITNKPLTHSTKIKSNNLYDILNLNRTATQSEIKSAYRNLAKRYHPDAVPGSKNGDDRDFIDIHNAYVTLFDPTSRAVYDLKLSSGFVWRSTGTGRRWETDQCW